MYTLEEIVSTLKGKGYLIYTEPNRLNIVGIRTNNKVSLTFDDYIAFFYYDENGNLLGSVCDATTDPSVKFLSSPINSTGAAILKAGQYVDSYKIGLHKGKYTALVQSKPVTVIRDNDRDSLLNFFAETETGMFGINIHRATIGKNNIEEIGADSAGCQVFKYVEDFNEMIRLAELSRIKYGNSFTYTLIDEVNKIKKTRNFLLLGLGFVLIGVSGYYYFKSK